MRDISAIGLAYFVPNAEVAIIGLTVLPEVSKLLAWNGVHGPARKPLKASLLAVGIVLMALNASGTAGYLSNHYEQTQMHSEATSHEEIAATKADRDLLQKRLD
jgi:hypothetical protein